MSSKIRKAVDNARDAANEVKHRTKATAEHIARSVAGNRMTAGEKLRSIGREDVEDTLADVDRAKRAIRKRT
jgi:hypothetical protein